MDHWIEHINPQIHSGVQGACESYIAVIYYQTLLKGGCRGRERIWIHSQTNPPEFQHRIVFIESSTFCYIEENRSFIVSVFRSDQRERKIPFSTQALSPISPPPTGIEPAELLLCVVQTTSYDEGNAPTGVVVFPGGLVDTVVELVVLEENEELDVAVWLVVGGPVLEVVEADVTVVAMQEQALETRDGSEEQADAQLGKVVEAVRYVEQRGASAADEVNSARRQLSWSHAAMATPT